MCLLTREGKRKLVACLYPPLTRPFYTLDPNRRKNGTRVEADAMKTRESPHVYLLGGSRGGSVSSNPYVTSLHGGGSCVMLYWAPGWTHDCPEYISGDPK